MKKSSIFIFDPANDRNIVEKTRLAIYDNIKKEFSHFKVLEANEVYEIPFENFDSHFNYKYKYQILDCTDEKPRWKDAELRYVNLLPEIIDDSGLKYVYLAPVEPSDKLIICFQALQRVPTYNYIRQINGVNAHRLYIKDGYGKDEMTRASLYLNEDNLIPVADLVQKIINEYVIDLKISPENVIFIGCSQGGYAALYHGYKYGAAHIIAGEPPIFLGKYEGLIGMSSMTVEDVTKVFENIAGQTSNDALRDYANHLLFNVISESTAPYPKVRIYMGTNEEHNEQHLYPFKEWIENNNIPSVILDKGDFYAHKELAKFFPPYLKDTLDKIINGELYIDD